MTLARGKPLERKTPLTSRTGLQRTDWKRRPPKDRPKPRMRSTKNDFPDDVKADVRRRSGNVCEICHTNRASQFHHRLLREHGDNRAVNCLHLCADCHTAGPDAVHRNVGKSYLLGWLVRSGLDPARVPVKRRGVR